MFTLMAGQLKFDISTMCYPNYFLTHKMEEVWEKKTVLFIEKTIQTIQTILKKFLRKISNGIF